MCTEELLELDFPGYAVGGLSVGRAQKNSIREVTEFTLQLLPFEKPQVHDGCG
jgi:queuine tRNA-ribosyltransferase